MIPTRMRKSTTAPPAMATLSRRSRIQAIWPSDRPSMASPLTPASTFSGATSPETGTSSGAAIRRRSPVARDGKNYPAVAA